MLKTQEGMDFRLEQRDEELHQLRSQSQVDGAQLAARVELEADYRSYGSPAIAHKRAEHPALKPIDRINLRLVHHELYCAT